jgi:hypothetical protein
VSDLFACTERDELSSHWNVAVPEVAFRQPLRLRPLAGCGVHFTALPVCAESTRNVVHARSQVFGSHASKRHTSMCTWDAEYGDGYFSVGQNILGDFTVVCRYCVCQCALLQNCRDGDGGRALVVCWLDVRCHI